MSEPQEDPKTRTIIVCYIREDLTDPDVPTAPGQHGGGLPRSNTPTKPTLNAKAPMAQASLNKLRHSQLILVAEELPHTGVNI